MGRCLSLIGMMVFTLGVVAMTSLVKQPAPPSLPPESDDNRLAPAPSNPRMRTIPAAFAYPARFSLN
jgi:hypothetical protein